MGYAMKAVISFIIIFLFGSMIFAQDIESFQNEEGQSFNGGLGMTWIDGKAFTTFTIAPEFAFGKFGVGLNIELLFDNAGGFKFRKEGWDKGAGILRMIRYLRWGVKHDPLYIRVGSLQSATLGHGFIMGYYTNEANYDQRKIGLAFDVDLERFGFETVTSNLGRIEVIGGRLYYRPLSTTGIPILKNLETGATYVTDIDPDNKRSTSDGVSELGVDIGLPIINSSVFNTTLYADYAKILEHGNGTAVGLKAGIPNVLGMLAIYAKLEKRFLSDEFLPNYFNTLYELERNELISGHYYLQNADLPPLLSKAQSLNYMRKTEGIFGELAGHILGKIRLAGNYQHLNNKKNSGILHLEARSLDLIPGVKLFYAYDKVGIETFEDVRTLDYRSVATAELGYRTYKFIYIALQYRWNFVFDEKTNRYKPRERFQPKISFSYAF